MPTDSKTWLNLSKRLQRTTTTHDVWIQYLFACTVLPAGPELFFCRAELVLLVCWCCWCCSVLSGQCALLLSGQWSVLCPWRTAYYSSLIQARR